MTGAVLPSTDEPEPVAGQLFARNSSGLIKGWSAWDAFRYAFFTVNPVILGFWAFSLAPTVGNGSLLWAAIIGTVLMVFAVLTYAALITIIPRAGADYVYQSRVLHGGLGFIITAAGIWFIMTHWAPIYAWSFVAEVLGPLSTMAGLDGVASFWLTPDGVFVGCLLTIAIASVLVAIGMRRLAKVQTWAFWVGCVGLVAFVVVMLVHSKEDFIAAFNAGATKYYGAGPDAYQATLAAGGVDAPGWGFPFKDTMLLIPVVLFWNIYIIWGAALAGEVRGAADFRKNVMALGGALALALALSLLFMALIAKTMGWDWWHSANSAYWSYAYGFIEELPVTAFPYPPLLATWMVGNEVVGFLILLCLGMFIVGFIGTLFLTPTRMIFAAAFDRVLPEWAAKVKWGGVPVGALVMMIIPSVVLSYLYAYTEDFAKYTLDAVVVLASAFLFTGIAAIVLPWRAKELYRSSPFATWTFAGVPVITLFGLGLTLFLAANMVAWFSRAEYGVNNSTSLVYMGVLYLLAVALYVIARAVRSRQGIPIAEAQQEIPAD
jgi:amino acid transporter